MSELPNVGPDVNLPKCTIIDVLEWCIIMAEQKIVREAGYGGQWEGYGPHMGPKTGPEVAEDFRKVIANLKRGNEESERRDAG
jgi:hypothetical protein